MLCSLCLNTVTFSVLNLGEIRIVETWIQKQELKADNKPTYSIMNVIQGYKHKNNIILCEYPTFCSYTVQLYRMDVKLRALFPLQFCKYLTTKMNPLKLLIIKSTQCYTIQSSPYYCSNPLYVLSNSCLWFIYCVQFGVGGPIDHNSLSNFAYLRGLKEALRS